MDQHQYDMETASFIDGRHHEDIERWQRDHECVAGDMTVPQAFRLALLKRRNGNLFLARRDYKKAQVQP